MRDNCSELLTKHTLCATLPPMKNNTPSVKVDAETYNRLQIMQKATGLSKRELAEAAVKLLIRKVARAKGYRG